MKKYRRKTGGDIVSAEYCKPGPRSRTRFAPFWSVIYQDGIKAKWTPAEFEAEFEEVES